MTIFIYGEDQYRARQKLNDIKNDFLMKNGSSLGLVVFDQDNFDFAKIKEAVMATSIFSEKKLIILENILSKGKKDLQEKMVELLVKNKISKDFGVVFFESFDLDSRRKLTKKILKSDQIFCFNPMSFYELNNWIENEIKKRGGLIEKIAINKLASFVGSDLLRLSKEIDKLIAYTSVGEGGKKQISVADIDLLVGAKLDDNIFNFTDALGRDDKNLALKLLHEQLILDNDLNYFLGMMVFQFRNLIRVKDLASKKYDQYQIAKLAKMHPYAVLKSQNLINNFDLGKLKKIYDQLFKIERDLKTGAGDILLKIDKFIVEM